MIKVLTWVKINLHATGAELTFDSKTSSLTFTQDNCREQLAKAEEKTGESEAHGKQSRRKGKPQAFRRKGTTYAYLRHKKQEWMQRWVTLGDQARCSPVSLKAGKQQRKLESKKWGLRWWQDVGNTGWGQRAKLFLQWVSNQFQALLARYHPCDSSHFSSLLSKIATSHTELG